MHGGAAERRRDRREGRAIAGRRRRLEGRRSGPLLEGIADLGALAQRHAARAHRRRRPHARPGGVGPVAGAGEESGGTRKTWWRRASCGCRRRIRRHTQDLVASGQLRVLAKNPAAYFIEYRDGLKAAMLMLDGAIKDFNFAARLRGVQQIQSTQFLLTPEPNVTYSACLMHKVEQLIES